ncbi:lipolytic enzyme, G-D-S-L [Novosphingobium nitrogenifigens DSM 19370]|uniref:Lipolytic enzyme, G-D-S-L n=1 Tax=Novosphingobium nitrogenifigens DSM 19370 TaxID=983920 RepID=F1ZDK5_9SPHN|nr:GDSL-type esterase/lipase family protein [Novosphingobium nitrogenifigens]EGD57254.1 lipolytic enzyme, G-D-S-L [Novosphingobium nitrogenifigens DSM 19370]
MHARRAQRNGALIGGMLIGALVVSPAFAAQSTQAPTPVPVATTAEALPTVAPDAVSAMSSAPCPPGRSASADWPAMCRYRDADRALGFPPRAIFIGDSITEWWLTTSPGMFAGGIVDRGIAGQTSPQILLRFYQDVVRLHPRVVHIMCGTNDVAGNTGPTSPEDYANAITAMADLAKANGIGVVIGSIPPASAFNWRPGYRPAPQIAALNTWLKIFALQRGFVFADYYAAMVGPDGGMKPGLSGDGVHPNAAGYAVMEPIAHASLAEAERRLGEANAVTAPRQIPPERRR